MMIESNQENLPLVQGHEDLKDNICGHVIKQILLPINVYLSYIAIKMIIVAKGWLRIV